MSDQAKMASQNNIPNDSSSLKLTSEQQKVLLDALNAQNSAINTNQLSSAPQTSQTSNSLSLFPFGYDFNPESSFDFDFSGDGPSLLGDTSLVSTRPELAESGVEDGDGGDSGASSVSGIVSSPSRTAEKRTRPDELDEDAGTTQGSSNKKREGKKPEKIPKKPGRKPLTEEPTTKRKAQNRAAQRAFRERKEKHVHDLEIKVEELEKASEEANNENSTLRSQIDRLTDELEQYKRTVQQMHRGSERPRGFGSAAINNMSDISFQFEFPSFGSLPGPQQQSPGLSNYSNASRTSTTLLPNSTGPANTSHAIEVNNIFNTKPSTEGQRDLAQFPNVFSSGPPSQGQHKPGPLSNIPPIGYRATSSSSASSNSNPGASSSCDTSPESSNQSPIGLIKSVDTMATIGEEASPMAITGPSMFDESQNSSMGSMHSMDLAGLNNLNMNFDWLARQNDSRFDTELFSEYREPQDNLLAMGLDDAGLFDNYETDFTTPSFNTISTPQAQPFKPTNLIQHIDAQKDQDDVTWPRTAAQPSTSQPQISQASQTSQPFGMPCNQVWDTLQKCAESSPQDFDLDALCNELKQKANCSGKGPVVKKVDFENVLKKYLGDKWPPKPQDTTFTTNSL
ncbi:DNA-binding transcription factor yap1 [Ceratocystis pirilliformis]|uniref:DNA-binding transcription factor yap1 n=1 Tax=Ceratocystis pirilliformis TaxID=259994 RepID=A0ABR3ZF89_9PEZI